MSGHAGGTARPGTTRSAERFRRALRTVRDRLAGFVVCRFRSVGTSLDRSHIRGPASSLRDAVQGVSLG